MNLFYNKFKALDVLFILHAEHELNCSTSAVRHLASSGVDIYSCISGGVAALYGPKHGGANEAVLRMLENIKSKEDITRYIEDVKSKKKEGWYFEVNITDINFV